MSMTRTPGRAGVLLIPIALILAACGGATGSSGAPTGSIGTSAATVTPGTPGASQPAGVTPGPSSGLVLPSFDISQLAAGLTNVDSYKVSITTGGVNQLTGTVVTKPVVSRDLTLAGGTHVVVIGPDAWLGQGGSPLTSVPGATVAGMLGALDPTLLLAAFAGPQWAGNSTNMGEEQKNGVSATHFHIDSSTVQGAFSGLPAGASVDLWTADAGYLVGLETKGFGSDTQIEVSNVDDPANKVDRPS
jgi:hypothetical protein